MSEQTHAESPEAHAEEHEHHIDYRKIYLILVALLIVSVLGPMLGIQTVTLLTAFGIAFVKAYLVVKNFMHLNVQPRFVAYLLSTCLVFMLLFFAGVAPDVMKKEGDNWVKPVVVVRGPSMMHHGDESQGDDHGGGEHH